MKIEVRFRQIPGSAALRDHVQRRAHFALSRFGLELVEVVAWLEDVNGPRGGLDKRCHLAAWGPRMGLVTIEETAADAYEAVDRSMHRAARAIARAVERARALGRAEAAR